MGNDDVLREIASLRVRLDELEGQVRHRPEPHAGSVEAEAPDGPTDRRRLLRYLAGAAGAGAVAVVANASPAAAVDGQAILAGGTESCQSTTGLVATTAFAGPVLAVRKSNTAFTQYNAAVQGSTVEDSGYGLFGVHDGDDGSAVAGYHSGQRGTGVFGLAEGEGGRGGSFSGDQAAIRLVPNGSAPPRPNVFTGDVVMDTAGALWVCVEDFPSQWRLLGGPSSGGALRMLTTPYRCHDTRPGEGPANPGKTKITTGQERTVDVGLGGTVPTFAKAALVNITATQTDAAGWLSAFPFGTAWPGTSTLNWSSAASNVANATIVAIDSSGRFTLRGNGSAHAIVDVTGFF